VLKLRSGLAPDSLFLDDEWVAIVLREAGLRERLALHLPMPVGFTLLAGLPTHLVGGSLGLQVLPVLAYLASLALFPVVIHRLSGSTLDAWMGMAMMAAAPLGAELAVRVKHYSLDQLVTVGILLAMAWLLRERSAARLGGWMLALLGGVLMSFSAVFLATAAVVTASVGVWIASDDAPEAKRTTSAVLGVAFLGAVGAFFALYVGRASRPVMVEYWSAFFPAPGSSGVWTFLTQRATTFFLGGLPGWAWIFALLAPLGFVWLWREGHRAYCFAIAGFYGLVLLAAFARIYPMGTGRTDAYAAPVHTLLICLGASELLRRVTSRQGRIVLHVAVIGFFVVSLVASMGPRYPRADDRAAVEWALARAGDGDGLVLSPYAAFAAAYYGDVPARLVPVEYYGHGFDVTTERPRTLTTALGRWDVGDATAIERERLRLASFVSDAPARLLYLETQGTPSTRAMALRTIAEGGYRLTELTSFGGPAEAFLFVRE
jgi:MFS family permease